MWCFSAAAISSVTCPKYIWGDDHWSIYSPGKSNEGGKARNLSYNTMQGVPLKTSRHKVIDSFIMTFPVVALQERKGWNGEVPLLAFLQPGSAASGSAWYNHLAFQMGQGEAETDFLKNCLRTRSKKKIYPWIVMHKNCLGEFLLEVGWALSLSKGLVSVLPSRKGTDRAIFRYAVCVGQTKGNSTDKKNCHQAV